MCKKNFHSSPFFTLDIAQSTQKTNITMKMNIPVVNTSNLLHTLSFLQKHSPRVLNTQCFNDKNLAFHSEVKATEIGHLFEHLLISELYLKKVSLGHTNVVFNGVTSWNWLKDPHGLFHIVIDIGKKEAHLLMQVIKKVIQLMEKLLAPALAFPPFLPAVRPVSLSHS